MHLSRGALDLHTRSTTLEMKSCSCTRGQKGRTVALRLVQTGTTELRAATRVGLIFGRIACRGQYFSSEFIRANQQTFTFAKVAYRRYLFIYFFWEFNDRIYHSIYMIILKC